LALLFVIAFVLDGMSCSEKALNFLALHEIATRPKPPFIDLLTPEGCGHCDRHIPRASLMDYSDLAFFKHRLDLDKGQSLSNACGHDHGSFQSFLETVQPVCKVHHINAD
jgi:hypothetical protein